MLCVVAYCALYPQDPYNHEDKVVVAIQEVSLKVQCVQTSSTNGTGEALLH